jgi:histone deacetylase 11
MICRFVYSPDCDFSLLGLERLHPFDGRRASRAWALFREANPMAAAQAWLRPTDPVTDDELAMVHDRDYLRSLRSSAVVARTLEIWPARLLPNLLLRKHVLAPMRLATRGTVMAAACALEGQNAMSFGGGYHHAFRDRGEGFCLFADVALAIAVHRASGRLGASDRVALIDLDAHRGNGFESFIAGDARVSVLDMFYFQVYPGMPEVSIEDMPFMIPVHSRTSDEGYLGALREALPRFLDAAGAARLAFYNAGTDILAGDRVGKLAISPAAVEERDRMVVDLLASRGIPTVITTAGGYSEESHRLIAKLAMHMARP